MREKSSSVHTVSNRKGYFASGRPFGVSEQGREGLGVQGRTQVLKPGGAAPQTGKRKLKCLRENTGSRRKESESWREEN